MELKEYLRIGIINIKHRQLRSGLTLIGVFISVAVIFILISLSLGLQFAIEEQFRQLGTDKLTIMPKGGMSSTGSTGAIVFTEDDFEVVKKVTGVMRATYFITGSAKVEYNKEQRYFAVYAIPAEGMELWMESGSLKFDEGRLYGPDERGSILMGYDYKYNQVFNKPIDSGSKVVINGKEFEVKGIMTKVGNPQDDKNIYMNTEDFRELFNEPDKIDYMMVQVESGQDIDDMASKVELKLRRFRGLDEKTQDFIILTPEQLLNSFKSVLAIITAFLLAVAAISLIVGGIGIANTMYTSVLERTKEIGIMKAIGAKNSDILLIFVIEAGLIGMLGGVLGVVLGYGVAKSIEYIAVVRFGTDLLKAAAPWYLVAGCIIFAFLIGVLSGLMPSKHASGIKTVDALRYE
jgi:putative ABC transport system permease protein